MKFYKNPIEVRDGHYVSIDAYNCWNCGIKKQKEGLKVRAEESYFLKLRPDMPPLEGRLFRVGSGGVPCGCGVSTIIIWSDPTQREKQTWLRIFDHSARGDLHGTHYYA